jgi:predicted metalloprotease with PDZ domain
MRSNLSAGGRIALALVALLALAPALLSAAAQPKPELRFGVLLSEPARPGYHKIGYVKPGSPAAALGLKKGHVIVAIDGKLFARPEDVADYIKDKAQITVHHHDGKDLYEVVADLEGGKVKGKPKTTKVQPRKGSAY